MATGVRYERAMQDKGLEWSRRLVRLESMQQELLDMTEERRNNVVI